MEIRKVSVVEPRVESGPVQFGDDWPGTFFRGDESAGISDMLRSIAHALRQTSSTPYPQYLEALADVFAKSSVTKRPDR